MHTLSSVVHNQMRSLLLMVCGQATNALTLTRQAPMLCQRMPRPWAAARLAPGKTTNINDDIPNHQSKSFGDPCCVRASGHIPLSNLSSNLFRMSPVFQIQELGECPGREILPTTSRSFSSVIRRLSKLIASNVASHGNSLLDRTSSVLEGHKSRLM